MPRHVAQEQPDAATCRSEGSGAQGSPQGNIPQGVKQEGGLAMAKRNIQQDMADASTSGIVPILGLLLLVLIVVALVSMVIGGV